MKRSARVCIGQRAQPVGQLAHVKDGAREYAAFEYDASWLAAADRFEVSPDLPLAAGHAVRRAPARMSRRGRATPSAPP